MRRTRMMLAAGSVLMLAVAGCSSDDEPDGDKKTPRPSAVASTPSRPSFDPPTRFDTAAAVALPASVTATKINLGGSLVAPLPVALSGPTLFVATAADLQVIDSATGKVRTTVAPDNKAVNSSDAVRPYANTDPAQPPLLADVDGVPTVLVPVLVSVPGQGTTAAGTAVELMAVTASDAKRRWTIQVAIEVAAGEQLAEFSTIVVGLVGQVAVLRAGKSTYGVDLTTKKVVWRQKGFAAAAVAGDVATGILTEADGFTRYAAAYAGKDGVRRWVDAKRSSELTVQAGGPKYVMITGKDYASGDAYYRLADAASGKAIETGRAGTVGYNMTCRYDQASVTVCNMNDWVSGFDARTGKWLWELPDKTTNRTAIKVTGAWHGAIYGTTGNGPIVLDARTGADRQQSPGAAPYVVDGVIGIASRPSDRGLYAFPAIG